MNCRLSHSLNLALVAAVTLSSMAWAAPHTRLLADEDSCSAHTGVCDTDEDCCDGLTCEQFTVYTKCIPEAAATDQLLQCAGHAGAIYGDPHILTFDDGQSDCHGQGEFVVAKASGYFALHARFDIISSGTYSSTSGVVMDIEGIDSVQVNFAEYDSESSFSILDSCPTHLYLDGALTPAAIGESVIGDGYVVNVTSSSVDLQFYADDDNTTPTYAIQLIPTYFSKRVGCVFHGFYCLPDTDADMLCAVEGLLGSPNGDSSDDWMYPLTGETAAIGSTTEEQYDYCTSHHCIRYESDSLFFYEDANGGVSFDDAEGCSEEYDGDYDVSEADDAIIEICGGIDNTACIVDGMLAGEDAALATVEAQEGYVAMSASNSTCEGDIVLLDTVGDTAYDNLPVSIVSQDGDSANITITAPFLEGSETVYVQYEYGFNSECLEWTNVVSTQSVEECGTTTTTSSTSVLSENILVSCPGVMDSTIVRVFVSDSGLSVSDNAEIPECCHATEDGNPKVLYSFEVSCVSQCPEATSVAARKRRG